MNLSPNKRTFLIVALFAPAVLTLAYLAATEFPQRPDGPALPLRASGDEDADLMFALGVVLVGLVFLGLATRTWSIFNFVPVAFAYTLANFFVIGWVTIVWTWLIREAAFTSDFRASGILVSRTITAFQDPSSKTHAFRAKNGRGTP
jgi:hypothetical protein